MPFDPSETYVRLASSGAAEPLPGGERFWSLPEPEIERLAQGWLVTELELSSDWSTWEMHPEAEEFVYLLSGEVLLLLEHPGGIEEVPLSDRAAVIVPRGTWHTARVRRPGRMLFITMGRGTQHRPAV